MAVALQRHHGEQTPLPCASFRPFPQHPMPVSCQLIFHINLSTLGCLVVYIPTWAFGAFPNFPGLRFQAFSSLLAMVVCGHYFISFLNFPRGSCYFSVWFLSSPGGLSDPSSWDELGLPRQTGSVRFPTLLAGQPNFNLNHSLPVPPFLG
uniref:Uncharacterized protein n=1 Tax=Sphaerodactylus townsendi TaxID=933632 RepID=A0ACB8EX05_9SAUR